MTTLGTSHTVVADRVRMSETTPSDGQRRITACAVLPAQQLQAGVADGLLGSGYGDAPAHEGLGDFCSLIVRTAHSVEAARTRHSGPLRSEPPSDDTDVQVRYWRGVCESIARQWSVWGFFLSSSRCQRRQRRGRQGGAWGRRGGDGGEGGRPRRRRR